jgi:hypothetical protein
MLSNRPPTPFARLEEMATPGSYDIDMADDETNSIIPSLDQEQYQEQGDDLVDVDTEDALETLDQHDNLTQLLILKREINHILIHNITPQEGWYDERFNYIRTYSQLGWLELAQRFHEKDQFIHDRAIYIGRICDELLEECSTKPNFHLNSYYRLIHEISNIWQYYHSKYVGDEKDEDVIDLIAQMSSMMR